MVGEQDLRLGARTTIASHLSHSCCGGATVRITGPASRVSVQPRSVSSASSVGTRSGTTRLSRSTRAAS